MECMKKLVIAHRGVSSMARENTLEAFQKAIDLRADMIEFDVRRTKINATSSTMIRNSRGNASTRSPTSRSGRSPGPWAFMFPS